MDYLKVFLHLNNDDILCVSETLLDSDIDDCEILIDGYNFCRVDTKSMEHYKVVDYYVMLKMVLYINKFHVSMLMILKHFGLR